MIKANMFYSESPKLHEYREMDLTAILKEFLFYKGTRDHENNPCNKLVSPTALCSSALWLYELKDNPTNRRNVVYYCEKKAREALWMTSPYILIPEDIWRECDEYNKKMTNRVGG